MAFPKEAFDDKPLQEFGIDGAERPRRHFSVRFDDFHVRPLLDGVEIKRVIECMTGVDGWVMYYPDNDEGHVHLCDCGDFPARAVAYGNVTVQERAA
jgi:hypothetical protein